MARTTTVPEDVMYHVDSGWFLEEQEDQADYEDSRNPLYFYNNEKTRMAFYNTGDELQGLFQREELKNSKTYGYYLAKKEIFKYNA